jgi:hypothetical protein
MMNFSIITTTKRKLTARALVTAMVIMITVSLIIGSAIANPIQSAAAAAQKSSSHTSADKMKDTFKVIVTLFGVDETAGDIVSFVNVDDITKVKTFNAAELIPTRGNNGTLDLLFAFANTTIKTGADFRACTMILKDLRMSCEKGQNSPALRPEFVDMYLSSAKPVKISVDKENSSQQKIGGSNVKPTSESDNKFVTTTKD